MNKFWFRLIISTRCFINAGRFSLVLFIFFSSCDKKRKQETLRVPENNSFSDWCAVNKWVRATEMRSDFSSAREIIFHFGVCFVDILLLFLHFSPSDFFQVKSQSKAKWNRQSMSKKTSEKAPKSKSDGWNSDDEQIFIEYVTLFPVKQPLH